MSMATALPYFVSSITSHRSPQGILKGRSQLKFLRCRNALTKYRSPYHFGRPKHTAVTCSFNPTLDFVPSVNINDFPILPEIMQKIRLAKSDNSRSGSSNCEIPYRNNGPASIGIQLSVHRPDSHVLVSQAPNREVSLCHCQCSHRTISTRCQEGDSTTWRC
ncbi:hypothetical protein KSP40_PGU016733 [Platanthera guangdongensis]|uniref:Uncharacterized protein n=1 Tax=Platanthera guangdongensis TaxID=2320717 RepID=A0ABR2LRP9_9ASPA